MSDNVEVTTAPETSVVEDLDLVPPDPKEAKKLEFKKETEELVKKLEEEKKTKSQAPKEKKKEPIEEVIEEAEKEAKPEAKAEETEAERKLKLTIDGEDVEMPEAEVKRLAQIAKAAQNREHIATKTAKQAVAFVKALKENPEAVLSHKSLGLDLEVLAEKILWNKLQQSLKTPEQIAQEEKEAQWAKEKEELEAYRKEKEEAKKRAEVERLEALKEKYRADFSQKFMAALESGKVPVDDWSLGRMAQYMRAGLKKNPKIEPKDVLPLVEADYKKWQEGNRELLRKEKERELEEKRKSKGFVEEDEAATTQEPKKTKKVFGSVEEMLRQ